MRRSVGLLVTVWLASVAIPLPAAARVIGVVFDNSGSMAGESNFPALLLQMLAVTLGPDDTLLVSRMSDYFWRYENEYGKHEKPHYLRAPDRLARDQRELLKHLPVRTRAEREATAAVIRDWGRREQTGGGTPLGSLELLLSTMLAKGRETGDELTLIVLTDGGFEEGQVSGPVIEDLIRAYKAEYPDTYLQTFFVGFSNHPKNLQNIREQDVGGILKKHFDVTRSGETFLVENLGRLREALTRILAAVNGTNIGRAETSIVEKRQDSISVNAPFSVSRITMIDLTPELRSPVVAVDVSPARARQQRYNLSMAEADRYDFVDRDGNQVGDDIWSSAVIELSAVPAVLPGEPVIVAFDSPPEDVILLFDSNISVQTQIVDAETGAVVPAGPDGAVFLDVDGNYEARTVIRDHPDGRSVGNPVDFRDLPGNVLFELRRGTGPRSGIEMSVNVPESYAAAPLRYSQEGDDVVTVTLSMPGFVLKTSNELRIRAVAADARIELSSRPGQDCPECAGGNARPTMSRDSSWIDVLELQTVVRTDHADAGGLAFRLHEPLPAGVRLTDADGRVLVRVGEQMFETEFATGEPEILRLQMDGAALDSSGDRPELGLLVETRAPLKARAAMSIPIDPRLPDARIVPTGTTRGGMPGDLLTLSAEEMEEGHGLRFVVEGSDEPVEAAFVQVRAERFELDLTMDPVAREFTVRPRKAFPRFDCCVPDGEHPIAVAFLNTRGQVARATLPFRVESVSLLDRLRLCWSVILGIIVIGWLIAGLINLLRSRRFPRRSRLLVYPEGERAAADRERLRRGSWAYIKPMLLPFLPQHEVRAVRGLRLKAKAGYLELMPGSYPDLYFNRDRKPVSQYFDGPWSAGLELQWGDTLRRVGAGREILQPVDSARDL